MATEQSKGRFWSAIEAQVDCLAVIQNNARVLKALWGPVPIASAVAPHKTTSELEFNQVVTVVKAGLPLGSPFYWSPRVLDIIKVAAETMPAWTFTIESLPSPHGFFWFDSPLPLKHHVESPVVALSWASVYATGRVIEAEGRDWSEIKPVGSGEDINAVHLTFWGQGMRTMRAIPYTTSPLAPGQTLNERLEEYRKTRTEANDFNENAWLDYAVKLRYFACCLSFLEQRIFGSQKVVGRLPRDIRRRLPVEPPLKDADATVTVVTLRAYAQEKPDEYESEAVDWQVRWIVRGHWRQQWYAKEQVHKPKWIHPYVKGPEGKPLKVGPKVFNVAR